MFRLQVGGPHLVAQVYERTSRAAKGADIFRGQVGAAAMTEAIETFRELLKAMGDELYFATSHINIYKQLDGKRQYQQVHDRYPGFFKRTLDAHKKAFYISITNVLDNDPHAPSLYRVLGMIDKRPDLAPEVQPRKMRRDLNNLRELSGRSLDLRNKRFAHRDMSADPAPVRFDESLALLEELQRLHDIIFLAHHNRTFDSGYSAPDNDSKALMVDLLTLVAQRRR